jgi:PAS domain S-box-containing protein
MSSREQLSELHAVFDEAPVPYVVTDRDLTITDANRAAQQFWGISLSGLVGQPLEVIVAPSDSRAFSRVVEEILQAPEPVTAADASSKLGRKGDRSHPCLRSA